MNLTLSRVAEFVTGTGEFDAHATVAGYSIDSRTLKPGEVFFAVTGDRFDGHDFVEGALKQGAVAAVVNKEHATRYACKTCLIVVEDTLAALQKMGAAVRRLWGKPLVGITGSAGKTTTKECVARVLGSKYRVLKSEGNLNNHFGLPLQLLKLKSEHEIAVIEMGMSHAGEIAALAKIAQPDTGVVTVVAPVHLEFFHSIREIARAKYELVEALPRGGCAVLNADDEYVCQFGRDFHGRVITFGVRKPADISAHDIQATRAGISFQIRFQDRNLPVQLSLIGEHNVHNALAALAVGLHHGVPLEQAAEALASITPADKRGEMLEIAGATIINDCYNSNPKALNAMVDALAKMPAQRRIVIAGEMLELGPAGEPLHQSCGAQMAGKVDVLLGVRGLAKFIVQSAAAAGVQAEFVETPEMAAEWLARNIRPGDLVLLKGSRGVRLERALERWRELIAA